MMKRIFTVLLACTLVLCAAGCGKKAGPADTIENFEKAFNQYDIDKMLDCLNPTFASTVRALLSVEGENYSLSHTMVLSLLRMGFPVLPLVTGGAISNDDLPKLSLDCGKVTEDGDTASVPVDCTLSLGGGSLSFRVTINLEKGTDDGWYITSLGDKGKADSAASDGGTEGGGIGSAIIDTILGDKS